MSSGEMTPDGKSGANRLLENTQVDSSPLASIPAASPPPASRAVSEHTAKTIHSLHLLQTGFGSPMELFMDEEEEITPIGAADEDNGEAGG